MARRRIVLADDHMEVARQLQGLLSGDYDVEVVCDGSSLLQVIRNQAPDALVLDITMPGMNGLAVARAALQMYPWLPVVFVTVTDAPEVIRSALSLGACGYVIKCDAGEELMAAVRAGFTGRTYLSAHAKTTHSPSQEGG